MTIKKLKQKYIDEIGDVMCEAERKRIKAKKDYWRALEQYNLAKNNHLKAESESDMATTMFNVVCRLADE